MSTGPARQGRSLASAGVFAIAAAAQRGLAFFLLPLYTSVLDPAAYGRVSLLASLNAAAFVILAGGLDVAVVREYVRREAEPLGQRRLVASVWTFQIAAAIVVSAALALVVWLVAPSGDTFRADEAAVALLASGVSVAATIVPMSVLRTAQRLKPFVALSACQGVATAVLTVLFVVVFRWSVMGWVIAMLGAATLSLLCAMLLLPWEPRNADDRAGVRSSLTLGLPLVPHAAAQWSLQVADRVLLAGIVSTAALGVYSLGANLCLPALIVIQSLNQAFMPTYARYQHAPDDVSGLRPTVETQVALVVWLGLAFGLVAPPLVDLVAPSSYGGAEKVVPWITLGYVFMGLYFVPMNGIGLILGKTGRIWVVTVTAALVNLAFIAVLTPPLGIVGAGVASAIGYGFQWLAVSWYASRQGLRLGYGTLAMARTTLAGVAIFSVVAWVAPGSGFEAFVFRGLAAVLAALPFAVLAGQRPSGLAGFARNVALGGRRSA